MIFNGINPIQENVENEKKRNAEEERVLGGSVVYYGQVIQVSECHNIFFTLKLVHFGTNMVLSGDRKQRSDLDPGTTPIDFKSHLLRKFETRVKKRRKQK